MGVIIKKGIPHPEGQNVLWMRLIKDGFIKKKGKRIQSQDEPNYFDKYKDILKTFIADPTTTIKNDPQISKGTPINTEDILFELVPEAYVDDEELSEGRIQDEIEKNLREYISYLIRFKKEARVFNNENK